MAKRIISIKMEEDLIEKLDGVAKLNHRKRGPEINVAVEFYLKYQGVDFEKLKQDVKVKEPIKVVTKKPEEIEKKVPEANIDCGDFEMN